MKNAFSLAAALTATFSVVLADVPKCGPGQMCPADAPCCSQYGQCGAGAYCLGGCDPQYSFSLQSCVAAPVCKTQDYKLTSLNDVAPNTKFLGDASKYNWVSSGTPVQYGDSLLLTMPPSTVGTLFSSTHYVWYGKISATLTTSQGAGVVTAFILMSDVKDEIDFEFVGVDLEHAQSNFYYQGITDYHNGANLTVSNTVQNSHTYEIDWQPDQITWGIDGKVLRTLKRSDTYNDTDKTYHYPQTPARVQLSLWPAGLQSNGQGTIDWAGGLVDWNSPLMQNGYYFARVTDVNVQCYDPPSNVQKTGNAVYYYTNRAGTEGTVAMGGNSTILSSFYASGDNPSYCPGGCASASGSATASVSMPSQSSLPETVPGVSGGGNAGNSGSTSSSDTSGNSEGGQQGASNGNSGSGNSGSGSGQVGFSQGTQPSTTQSGDASKLVTGSVAALVAFFAVALML